MTCEKCPYASCELQFSGNDIKDCPRYQENVAEEQEWYEEELRFQENMRQLYQYDENGFCDGFPR